MRIGLGFDIHRLERGRKLILAGIQIPFHSGLKGHSDGDVILHSISDAIAGALGIEDIGTRFPDSDAATKGIDSRLILESYSLSLKEAGAKILNLDLVIIAETPKFKPWYEQMKQSIGDILKIRPSCIGIKAKTMEGIGEIGGKNAIACLSSVLIDDS
ncbi:MAG: 2-C-methyl-D-erythritol 2,4-cyclodiphosphate synthase [bacterium]|nr:2-C-methyl-D-erythritol 2,4-cyclodiphosphate synthase [bacterium]